MQALVSGSVPMRCGTECGRLEGEVLKGGDGGMHLVGSTPGFGRGESRGVEGAHAFTSLKVGERRRSWGAAVLARWHLKISI